MWRWWPSLGARLGRRTEAWWRFFEGGQTRRHCVPWARVKWQSLSEGEGMCLSWVDEMAKEWGAKPGLRHSLGRIIVCELGGYQ